MKIFSIILVILTIISSILPESPEISLVKRSHLQTPRTSWHLIRRSIRGYLPLDRCPPAYTANVAKEATGILGTEAGMRFISFCYGFLKYFIQWVLPPAGEDSPQYTFPEPDLLATLVDLYFKVMIPLTQIHRAIYADFTGNQPDGTRSAPANVLREPRYILAWVGANVI